MARVATLPNNSCKPITSTAWVRARLCRLQKGCTRVAAASDKVYQLFAHGRWFSPGTPVSSTTKTGRHDIAEILLKVALKKSNQIKSIKGFSRCLSSTLDYVIVDKFWTYCAASISFCSCVRHNQHPTILLIFFVTTSLHHLSKSILRLHSFNTRWRI